MAGRKTAMYPIADEGRDKGKVFLITEMSSADGEWWAMRVLMALMSANVDLPEDFQTLGMAGLAQLGIRAIGNLKPDVAKPLMDELMDCVKFIPDPKRTQTVRELIDEDIEEILTRLRLKQEVLQLHMGFLSAVMPSLSNGTTAVSPELRRTTRTSRKS